MFSSRPAESPSLTAAAEKLPGVGHPAVQPRQILYEPTAVDTAQVLDMETTERL